MENLIEAESYTYVSVEVDRDERLVVLGVSTNPDRIDTDAALTIEQLTEVIDALVAARDELLENG